MTNTSIVNVADLAAVSRFASEVEEQHGSAPGDTFEEVSLEDLAWLMDVNFW